MSDKEKKTPEFKKSNLLYNLVIAAPYKEHLGMSTPDGFFMTARIENGVQTIKKAVDSMRKIHAARGQTSCAICTRCDDAAVIVPTFFVHEEAQIINISGFRWLCQDHAWMIGATSTIQEHQNKLEKAIKTANNHLAIREEKITWSARNFLKYIDEKRETYRQIEWTWSTVFLARRQMASINHFKTTPTPPKKLTKLDKLYMASGTHPFWAGVHSMEELAKKIEADRKQKAAVKKQAAAT